MDAIQAANLENLFLGKFDHPMRHASGYGPLFAGVGNIIDREPPSEMLRVDASEMPISTFVQGKVIGRRRSAVCYLANIAVRVSTQTINCQSTVALAIRDVWPWKACVRVMLHGNHFDKLKTQSVFAPAQI